jgi:hypothetical protein
MYDAKEDEVGIESLLSQPPRLPRTSRVGLMHVSHILMRDKDSREEHLDILRDAGFRQLSLVDSVEQGVMELAGEWDRFQEVSGGMAAIPRYQVVFQKGGLGIVVASVTLVKPYERSDGFVFSRQFMPPPSMDTVSGLFSTSLLDMLRAYTAAEGPDETAGELNAQGYLQILSWEQVSSGRYSENTMNNFKMSVMHRINASRYVARGFWVRLYDVVGGDPAVVTAEVLESVNREYTQHKRQRMGAAYGNPADVAAMAQHYIAHVDSTSSLPEGPLAPAPFAPPPASTGLLQAMLAAVPRTGRIPMRAPDAPPPAFDSFDDNPFPWGDYAQADYAQAEARIAFNLLQDGAHRRAARRQDTSPPV